MIQVKEIMATDVISLKPTDTLALAQALMAEKNIRHIPVVDENKKLLGLVSQRDLLRAAGASLDAKDAYIHANREGQTELQRFMTKTVRSIRPQESLRYAGLLMQQEKIGCLPVLNEGALAGIVTDTDFVGVAINLLEQVEQMEEIDGD